MAHRKRQREENESSSSGSETNGASSSLRLRASRQERKRKELEMLLRDQSRHIAKHDDASELRQLRNTVHSLLDGGDEEGAVGGRRMMHRSRSSVLYNRSSLPDMFGEMDPLLLPTGGASLSAALSSSLVLSQGDPQSTTQESWRLMRDRRTGQSVWVNSNATRHPSASMWHITQEQYEIALKQSYSQLDLTHMDKEYDELALDRDALQPLPCRFTKEQTKQLLLVYQNSQSMLVAWDRCGSPSCSLADATFRITAVLHAIVESRAEQVREAVNRAPTLPTELAALLTEVSLNHPYLQLPEEATEGARRQRLSADHDRTMKESTIDRLAEFKGLDLLRVWKEEQHASYCKSLISLQDKMVASDVEESEVTHSGDMADMLSELGASGFLVSENLGRPVSFIQEKMLLSLNKQVPVLYREVEEALEVHCMEHPYAMTAVNAESSLLMSDIRRLLTENVVLQRLATRKENLLSQLKTLKEEITTFRTQSEHMGMAL